MMKPSYSDLPEIASLDPEAAAALDAVLDELQSGRAVDRKTLLVQHPQLAEALAASIDCSLNPSRLGNVP